MVFYGFMRLARSGIHWPGESCCSVHNNLVRFELLELGQQRPGLRLFAAATRHSYRGRYSELGRDSRIALAMERTNADELEGFLNKILASSG
jgi:hypothetical protein